jgi:hypothetical protein
MVNAGVVQKQDSDERHVRELLKFPEVDEQDALTRRDRNAPPQQPTSELPSEEMPPEESPQPDGQPVESTPEEVPPEELRDRRSDDFRPTDEEDFRRIWRVNEVRKPLTEQQFSAMLDRFTR